MERIVSKEYRSYWMGIAILFVVFDHLVNLRGTDDIFFKIIKMVFMQGAWGVNVFFFLSAYGLCFSFRNNTIFSYYIHRLQRLFPIYFIYLLFIMFYRIYNKGAEFDLYYFIDRLLGLNILNGKTLLAGDAWYMSAVILLYAFFPVVFVCIKFLSEKWTWIFATIILLTFCFYIPTIRILFYGLFLARFHVIILGVCTFFIFSNSNRNKNELLILYSLTASLSLLTYNDCEFFFFIPLLLWAIDRTRVSFPLYKVLSFMGKHSLEIYLSQAFIIQELFSDMTGYYYYDAFICILSVVLLSFILWAIHYYFWKIIRLLLSYNHKMLFI